MDSNRKQIHIFKDSEDMIRYAGEVILAVSETAVNERAQFHFVLSGGGTPGPLYELLAQSIYREKMPWQMTSVYWGDERCVPPDDPGSNYGQAKKLMLAYVPISEANIHRVKGELSPSAAAEDYRNQLLSAAAGKLDWPRFDVVLLGLGSDGHTASLFPGLVPRGVSDQPVVAVTAYYGDRPANRVTLTPTVFNSARLIIFLVNGLNKAEALSNVLEGPYQPELWPAQLIKPSDGRVLWLLDNPASRKLVHRY